MNTVYQVFESNADLRHLKYYYEGISLDIAETISWELFKKSNQTKDFLVWDFTNEAPKALLPTEQTKRIRALRQE